MRFTSTLLAGAFAVLAAATQKQNPFTRSSYTGIAAGVATEITWDPTSAGPISLVLVKGDSDALVTIATLESGVENSGSFLWTPSTTLVKASDYALKIVDDSDATMFNFTPLFAIDSDVVASSAVSSSAPASSTVASTSSSAESSTSSAESSTSSAESSTSSAESSTSSAESSTITSESSSASSSASSTESSSASESSSEVESSRNATTTAARSTPTQVPHNTETATAGGAIATAKVGAGLIGFVGAAMLML